MTTSTKTSDPNPPSVSINWSCPKHADEPPTSVGYAFTWIAPPQLCLRLNGDVVCLTAMTPTVVAVVPADE